MAQWRRLFDRLLLVGAVAMGLVSLIAIVSTIRTVRDTAETFNDSLTFYISQVEYETMQLLDTVDRFDNTPPGVPIDEVTLRFDILWSRVFIDRAELMGASTDISTTTAEMIAQFQTVLEQIEPNILNLGASDPASVDYVKFKLRELIPQARKVRLAVRDIRAADRTAFLGNQLRQTYLIFGLITGMAVFGVLSTLLLRADRQEVRMMNTRLEERVRQRTEDLQSANRRLAAEIAERRRSQDLAEERETRLEQAVQLAKLGYYVWDTDTECMEFCSGQFASAFGMTPSEMKETCVNRDAILALIHPDDREKLKEKYAELEDGQIIDIGFRVITRFGVRRLREVSRPVFDVTGRIMRTIGSTLDVTDQYETEMKLFEAQKMDSIGKMTGGVAHDFNNLLAVILGNLELLREIPNAKDRDEMIDDAIKASLRGRDLTMNMLSFARRAPVDPSDLDLNQIIGEMRGMLRRTLPESINLTTNLTDNIWTVSADRSLTESAVLNLVINARDAMPDGGQLTISTQNMTLTTGDRSQGTEDLEPGNYVRMSVSDTGRGIKKELLANIFEPFFTTKAITKNSGLGLSMVQGFVRQTGGTVFVTSEPSKKTTFDLYFKASEATVSDHALPPISEDVQMDQPIRVLLVEDDDTVRKILTRQMEKLGMSVSAAAESIDAERLFCQKGPFDIVVSDIVMPGEIQGPALIRRLREIEASLPAVLLSGYPQEAAAQGNNLNPNDVMLMKPVGRDDLYAAINLAINPPA